MDNVQVPAVGLVLAVVAAMMVGMVWYSRSLFGKQWMKMVGLKEADMKSGKGTGFAMGSALVSSVLTAYVLAHVINYAHAFNQGTWLSDSLSTAFWTWLGFSATTIVIHGAFEPRERMLMVLNAANRLVTYLLMGLMLGLFFQ